MFMLIHECFSKLFKGGVLKVVAQHKVGGQVYSNPKIYYNMDIPLPTTNGEIIIPQKSIPGI